ncbi:uncharacterized protein LAESUDRAFT_718667, partial [Laetiporus sulphureus 93-53]
KQLRRLLRLLSSGSVESKDQFIIRDGHRGKDQGSGVEMSVVHKVETSDWTMRDYRAVWSLPYEGSHRQSRWQRCALESGESEPFLKNQEHELITRDHVAMC